MSEVKLETRFVSEITGKFFVPSYQRGYRWGKDEVTRLLNDVYNLPEQSENYCLQPIVVKNFGNYFEVIDGQAKNSWTLEHIHAVNTPQGSKTLWRKWLALHKKSLKSLSLRTFINIFETDDDFIFVASVRCQERKDFCCRK